MGIAIEVVSTDPAVRSAAARAFTPAPPDWRVTLREAPSGDADVVVTGPESASEGAVTFDPARPADVLRDVEARVRLRGRGAVVVTGAVGGAGTTTVALHLAASWGRGACCADLAGGAAARLGLPEDARTWLPGDDDVAASALPVSGAFRVLCAPSPCPSARHFPMAAAAESFDRLVVDAGVAPELDAVLAHVRAAVLVTTPTRTGATAARRILEGHPALRWAVVTNRVGPGGQLMRRGIESLLGRSLTLELPSCPALRDAEDEARLLDGRWRRWTRAMARLAAALETC